MKEFGRALACIGLGSMLLLGIFIIAADPTVTVADDGPASFSSPSSQNDTIFAHDSGQIYYDVSGVNAENSSRVLGKPATLPSAPMDLATLPGDARATLTWLAPSKDGHSPITGYNVYRGTTSDEEVVITSLGDVLTFTDTGLTNDGTYYYRVSAINLVGEGPWSNEASAAPGTVPTAPRGLLAEAGDVVVDLSWTAPSYTGPGTLIYHLFRDGSLIWSGTRSTHSDILVNNGITYQYKVAASNSLGYGVNCTAVSATPMSENNVPTAPYGLTATPSSSLIHLNWTAPSYLGPGTISYHLFRDGTLVWSGSALGYDDASVLSFVVYSYMVAAENSFGRGPNSSEVFTTLTASPGVPMNFVATASDAKVNLSWEPPMNSGSTPILGYKVYRMDNSVMTLMETVTSGTNCTDIAVSNGGTYYYQVRAFNSIGDGSATEIRSATPQATQADPIVVGPDLVLYGGIGAITIIAFVDVALILRRKNK